MQDTTQPPEQQRHGGIDPRKAVEPSTIDRMLHAQAVARAQAQAASTVVISTIVSLVTSAFGFVAALAWNSAIQKVLEETVMPNLGGRLGDGGVLVVYALLVTLLAIVVVFLLNRIASRWVKKSAAEAAKADHGLLP
jgi:hypothetical protein